MNIDDEWKMYLAIQSTASSQAVVKPKLSIEDDKKMDTVDSNVNKNVPKCDDLYISTKTKVIFLNFPVDIHNIFWKIPVIEYWIPKEGVIKKQMKIVSNSQEEYEEMKKNWWMDIILQKI
jgi:hypothetical protein